jgi:hypothetical protein
MCLSPKQNLLADGFSSTIIEETKTYCSANTSKESQLAYYYFSFTDVEKQKPGNLLRSIIAQLVSGVSEVPMWIQKLYDGYYTSELPLDVLKLALKSVLEVSIETSILIDALDECFSNQGSREQLCKILVEISNWSIPVPGLHILATSRKRQIFKNHCRTSRHWSR